MVYSLGRRQGSGVRVCVCVCVWAMVVLGMGGGGGGGGGSIYIPKVSYPHHMHTTSSAKSSVQLPTPYMQLAYPNHNAYYSSQAIIIMNVNIRNLLRSTGVLRLAL